jgi:hypothetical protein
MDSNTKSIITQIQNSTKIALCSNTIDSVDKAYSLALLMRYFDSIGKDATLILPNGIDQSMLSIVTALGLEFSNDAKPLSYVISIDYGTSELEKVTYDTDEESGMLKFYIVPSGGGFDFENVEYSTEGKSYDLTITLGIDSFRDMGNVYDNNGYLFKDNEVISISQGAESLGDTFVNILDDETYVYGTYTLIKEKLTTELKTFTLTGILALDTFLEGGAAKSSWGALGELVKDGADIDEALRDRYFAKSYSNLDLLIKKMHNIKVAKDAKVIWSTVSLEDMKYCNLKPDDLDVSGRLPFNISKDFALAIGAYQIGDSKVRIVIESNDISMYSASNIAGVFGGSGNEKRAEAIVNDLSIKDFEKRFFTVLSDMYDTEVKGQGIEFRAVSSSTE